MPIITIQSPDLRVSCSKNVRLPLMVCSHERSGTHFLMNSLASVTHYSINPYLDYDFTTLGSQLNFFAPEKVNKFFSTIAELKIDDGRQICVNSILKSHFPLSFLGSEYDGKCKIIYIYRNPVDVFISYWRVLHRWNWFEGPKVSSPLELMKSIPCGQSQRYQINNYPTYFDRWANHVKQSYQLSLNSKQIMAVSYNRLNLDYNNTIENICDQMGLAIISDIKRLSRNNYIPGKNLIVSPEEKEEMTSFCIAKLKLISGLPSDLFGI